MAHKNIDERQALVRRFAEARVEFSRPVIRAFATVFQCSETSIYSDLRALEPETGRLLENPPSAAKT
jgi:hypothetical protein